MLTEEKFLDTYPASDEANELQVTAHVTDAARTGVVDVVSLRALARVVKAWRGHSEPDAFNAALTRIINSNGQIARTLEGD